MRRSPLPLAASVLFALLWACGLPVTSGPGRSGALCVSADDCGSGFCVDGVCCQSACDGVCASCAVAGKEGECAAVPEGLDPRQDCGTGSCAGVCDGAEACRFPGQEVTCGEKVCAGDTVQQPACDGTGRCGSKVIPCAPYGCEDGACLHSCADPQDCSLTGRCLPEGTCEAKLPAGTACAAGAACASGFCVDGVCCDRPCAGSCEACGLPGSVGTCAFIPEGEDPALECPGEGPCGASCNGAGRCAFGAAGTSCGAAACSGPDAPVTAKSCNGAGACVEVPGSCGEYACVGNACRTACGSASDCRSTAFCSDGSCLPRRALGESCTSANQCLSGNCADGVCCSSGCDDACDSCIAGTPGLCSPLGAGGTPQLSCGTGQACGQSASCPAQCSASAPCAAGYYCGAGGTCQPRKAVGTFCALADECGSGFCDDGVCCAEDCSASPCRACNTSLSALGQCLPLPWGTSGQNCAGLYACRADGLCASGACADDRDCDPGAFCAGAGGCQAQRTPGQSCTRDRECGTGYCVDGVCCDSGCAGACRACNLPGSPGSCTSVAAGEDPFGECPGGLACNGSGACDADCACAPSCSASPGCESGFVCSVSGGTGACVPGKGLGQSCASADECGSGYCVDGVCCGGACAGPCLACNLPQSTGTCTPLPANTTPQPPDCPGGYTCNGGGSCRTSCISGAQCQPGYGCASGACVLLAADGAACLGSAGCQSGHCVDGVCCNSGCGAQCEACNVPGQLGACLPFAAGTDPQGECGTHTCNGRSACGTVCALDQDCAVGSYCNGGGCAPKKAVAQSCAANNECTSNFCADGVCCNAGCAGACRSCALSGSVGTCTLVADGADPDQECLGGLTCTGAGACYPSCASAWSCEASYYCSGGSCLPDLAQGQACTDGAQCPGNQCVDGVCCASACNGTCETCNQPGSQGQCTPYAARTDPELECGSALCSGSGSCLVPCGSDLDCKGGHYCQTSSAPWTCQPKQANGAACSAGNECQSSFCVDGVCCDALCDGSCAACNLGGSEGTCLPVPARQDPANECGAALCSGAGSCSAPCGSDLDCKAGNYCESDGTCQPKRSDGSTCAAGSECQSGACADGVCCNGACSGICRACNEPGSVGTCAAIPARTDPANECGAAYCDGAGACLSPCGSDPDCKAGDYCDGTTGSCQPKKVDSAACAGAGNQCLSGNCVDGVCCDGACAGTCESCALAGSIGVCSAYPAGTDPQSECGNYQCSGASACSAQPCASDAQCKPPAVCQPGLQTCQ